MTKLKPCPFCGGRAIISTLNNNSTYNCVGFVFRIECEKCGIQNMRRFNVEFSLRDDGEINIFNDEREAAVEMWNRRAEK